MNLYLLLFLSVVHAQNRSRIIFQDGNILFQAENSQIVFKSDQNGGIFFNKTDVTKLPDKKIYDQMVKKLESAEQSQKSLASSNFGVKLENAGTELTWVAEKTKVISDEMKNIQQFVDNNTETQRELNGEIEEYTTIVNEISDKLKMNACETNECENGGTCIPIHGEKFMCICRSGFTGSSCESDVDECEFIGNTDLECQNGGQCVNTLGGYECNCTGRFYGPLCNATSPICTPRSQLCGPHGFCIEASDNTYTCACDTGYQKSSDKHNPRCIDINECESNPCHPGVQCVNIAGSYVCHGCPTGFRMDGVRCVDIDECETHPHPCDPLTKCQNLMGSYSCTSCPPGYEGDSKKKCVKTDVCSPNNCPLGSICVANEHYLNYHGYICTCPKGYIGTDNSTGLEMCISPKDTVCENSPCLNGGTCNLFEDTYKCACERGYLGKNCEKSSPCFTNKCGKNGVCKVLDEDKYYCHCDHEFYGEQCEFQQSMFDEHITSLNGTYSFKLNQIERKHVRNLYFDISETDAQLFVTFQKFSGFEMTQPGATDCTKTFGNLTIFDGNNDNYPVIATYCGDEKSPLSPFIRLSLMFTSSTGLIRFEGLRGEYSIKYSVQETKCGFRTSKSEGQIVVPKSNSTHGCLWTIHAPESMVIELNVSPINFKNRPDCYRNVFVVSEMPIKRRRFLYGQHGESSDYQTIRSKTSYMIIFFAICPSDDDKPQDAISMSWKFVKPDQPKCGGIIVNSEQRVPFSGIIKYPETSEYYPPNMLCTWEIHPAGKDEIHKDLLVTLNIHRLDIPSEMLGGERICGKDYLRIGNEYEIIDLCNEKAEQTTIKLDYRTQFIYFHSDDEVEGKGFEIGYEVTCGREIVVEDKGSIQTFNFPNGGNAGECTYVLKNKEDKKTMLIFKSIRLNVLSFEDCRNANQASDYPNYIEIEQKIGDISFSTKFFCQSDFFIENSTIFVSNETTIRVISDGNPNFQGISFEYHSVHDGCGDHFDGYSGMMNMTKFFSPNYPSPYGPNLTCNFFLNPKIHEPILLVFEKFDVGVKGVNDTCDGDRIIIKKMKEGEISQVLCGDEQDSIQIDDFTLVQFISVENSSQSEGFSARLKTISFTNRPIDKYTSTVPVEVFYLSGEYFHNADWPVIVDDDRHIVFNVTGHIEPCHFAKLVIYDGLDDDSNILYEKSCGDFNDVFFTTSNKARIVFNTTFQNDLATIRYHTLLKTCGGVVHDSEGAISTPQYPLRQYTNMECYWTVAVAQGNRVELVVDDIDYNGQFATGNNDCTKYGPALEITENILFDSKKLTKICKPSEPVTIISSKTNRLDLFYVQSQTFSSRGFKVSYKTICKNIILTNPRGDIQSPGYPVRSLGVCDWKIRVPKGNRIEILFHDYRTRSDWNGFKFNITNVSHGKLKNGSSFVGDYDGKVLSNPLHLFSTHNEVEISYDNSRGVLEMWLSYQTVGCVKDIDTPGNITIYRNDIDSDRAECQYKIQAPIGKNVKLTIKKFNLRKEHEECIYSSNNIEKYIGLAVFMGLSNSSGDPYYGTCEFVENYIIESQTDEMFLHLLLDRNRFKKSDNVLFDAIIEFVEKTVNDTCGGIVNLNDNKEHRITSPGYPSLYPPETSCRWLFRVPEHRHIEYTIEKFDVSTTQQVFEKFDGSCNSFNAGSLNLYATEKMSLDTLDISICDNSSVGRQIDIYESSSIVEFIGASTPSEINSTIGFVLSAKSVCGGIYYTKHHEIRKKLTIEGSCNITIRNSNDEKDSSISVRLEKVPDFAVIFADGQFLEIVTHSKILTAKNEIMINFRTKSKEEVHFKYISGEMKCGGHIAHAGGFIELPEEFANQPINCKWFFENTPGNVVDVSINKLALPESVNCSDSYVEIENYDDNSVERICEHTYERFTGTNISVCLRYLPDSSQKFEFSIRFVKLRGGFTSLREIRPPIEFYDNETVEWIIGQGLEAKSVEISLSHVYLSSQSYLEFVQFPDLEAEEIVPLPDLKAEETVELPDFEEEEIVQSPYREGQLSYRKITGSAADSQFIIPYLPIIIRAVLHSMDDFKIIWKPIPDKNSPGKCGGNLDIDSNWKTISRPDFDNDEIHCIWTIYRPIFMNIELDFKTLDVGKYQDCSEEYIMLKINSDSRDNTLKLCKKARKMYQWLPKKRYNILEIHYISKNKKNGKGFELSYRTNCNRIEAISEPVVLTPPENMTNCKWNIWSLTHRFILVTVNELDMDCASNNTLDISFGMSGSRSLCGLMNSTSPIEKFMADYLSIQYKNESPVRNNFKIILQEKHAECDNDMIRLDEKLPSTIIYSPNYPESIPSSSECTYLIFVPHGHRVMLTFDPEHFDLDLGSSSTYSANKPEDENHIEVRDGSSESAKLVGYYSGHHAPSTIYSTGNVLFMKLRTLQYSGSQRFVANVSIATCGGVQVIQKNQEVKISSPAKFKTPLSCQWHVRSVHSEFLLIRIRKASCHTFTIQDSNSTLLDKNCDLKHYSEEWTRSSSYQLTISFNPQKTSDTFEVLIRSSDQGCGGIISDDEGEITVPGYPNQLMSRIKCKWEFQAGIEFVYRLEFKFIDTTNFNGGKCFMDLRLSLEHFEFDESRLFSNFCEDQNVRTTTTDMAIMEYDDRYTRYNVYHNSTGTTPFSPFVVKYTKIPAEGSGCSMLITNDTTIKFGKNTNLTYGSCHIRIQKEGKMGGFIFRMKKNEGKLNGCRTSASIKIVSQYPIPYDQVLCEKSKESILFINNVVDIYLSEPQFSYKSIEPDEFTITFVENSGYVSLPFGTFRSPNYDGLYLPNSMYMWLIQAPKNMKIKLTIDPMSIENSTNCENDRLTIGEGNSAELNPLKIYCGEQDEDKSKYNIISKSRNMVVHWRANDKIEKSGFMVHWRFVHEDFSCGYHTTAMFGVIEMPGDGKSQYSNNLTCLWDIKVPAGYHLNLTFDYFDVEDSLNCVNDRLTLRETGFDDGKTLDVEDHSIHCGQNIPKPIETGFSRMQLNFTSNESENHRGFKITWNAVCGAVHTNKHGIVTMPRNLENYPKETHTCGYIIKAKPTEVVNFKFEELSLSKIDKVKILDENGKIIFTASEIDDQRIYAIRGTIEIVFLNEKPLYQDPHKPLLHPFFTLKYKIIECGGKVNLSEDSSFSVEIETPKYLYTLDETSSCVWNISTTSDRAFEIKVRDYPSSTSECSSHFEIHDSAGNYSSCSTTNFVDIPIHRKGPFILIKMVIVPENQLDYKLLIESYVDKSNGCGGLLKASKELQTIVAPRNNDGNIPRDMKCSWNITSNDNARIVVQINKNVGCDGEKLKLYDEYDHFMNSCNDSLSGIHVRKFFGVEYESSNGGSGEGFIISYVKEEEPCYHELHADGSLQTFNSSNSSNCEFLIDGKPKSPILINFQTPNDCEAHQISFEPHGDETDCHHPACYSHSESSSFCNGTYLAVIIPFKLMLSTKASFEYQVLDSCNRVIDIEKYPSGVLESVDQSFQAGECITKLNISKIEDMEEVPKVLVVFKHLRIGEENSDDICNQNHLVISANNQTIRNICRTMIPPAILTNGEEDLTLTFKTDNMEVDEYEASYFTVNEELENIIRYREIDSSRGVIASYDGFNKTMKQEFIIDPPLEKTCIFTVLNLRITSCTEHNYLVIDAITDDETHPHKFCHIDDVDKIVSVAMRDGLRYFEIHFESENYSSTEEIGFKMQWDCYYE